MPAFAAMGLDCGHARCSFALNDEHRPLVTRYLVHLRLGLGRSLLSEAAFSTFYVTFVRDHYTFTLGTEFHGFSQLNSAFDVVPVRSILPACVRSHAADNVVCNVLSQKRGKYNN